MGILGSAGAGKSALLNILATFVKPEGGKLKLLGYEPKRERSPLLPKIGIWLEEEFLIPFLTIWQNLWLFSLFLGVPYHLRRGRISKYLSLAGLWELRKRTVESLSLRERGLVNAIRVILNEPSLLILDEPERELDARGMRFLLQQINRLRKEHDTAVLWASVRGEWLEQADRVAIMKRGRIIACDTPLNLKRAMSKELSPAGNAPFQPITLERIFLSLTNERDA